MDFTPHIGPYRMWESSRYAGTHDLHVWELRHPTEGTIAMACVPRTEQRMGARLTPEEARVQFVDWLRETRGEAYE